VFLGNCFSKSEAVSGERHRVTLLPVRQTTKRILLVDARWLHDGGRRLSLGSVLMATLYEKGEVVLAVACRGPGAWAFIEVLHSPTRINPPLITSL